MRRLALLLCVMTLRRSGYALGGAGAGNWGLLQARSRTALLDKLRQAGTRDVPGSKPSGCLDEDFVSALAECALTWWVAEGQHIDPHFAAELDRRFAQAVERDEKASRGEREDPTESGRWARPLIRPWWYMVPLYFKFDFETFLFPLPLRRDSLDAALGDESCGQSRRRTGAACEQVTVADLTKKLFKCAYKGQARRVRACVRAGALINAPDFNHPDRLTPFLWAAYGGFACTLEALSELGADMEARDANDRDALHLAAAHGHVTAATAIYNLTDGNLYTRDAVGRFALHAACLEGHTSVAELLLELGSNVNALDVRQDSALHLACRYGHTSTVRQLVWHGADPWQRNSLDLMPIDVAEKYGHRESYYFLEHVVGEKCIFDRLPDAMFTCGLRHADTPVELYHRADVADLAPFEAPEKTVWRAEEEAVAAHYAAMAMATRGSSPSAAAIYKNPEMWEQAIKTPVDLFPGAGTGQAKRTAKGDADEDTEEDSLLAGDGEWITHGEDPTKSLKSQESNKTSGSCDNARNGELAGEGGEGAARAKIVWLDVNVTVDDLNLLRAMHEAATEAVGEVCAERLQNWQKMEARVWRRVEARRAARLRLDAGAAQGLHQLFSGGEAGGRGAGLGAKNAEWADKQELFELL